MEEIKIRLLTPDDKEKAEEFFRNLGEDGTNFFNRNNGNRDFLIEFLEGKHQDRIYWGAVVDTDRGEEIAGIVFLWDKDKKVTWLGIGITPDYKGKHLGRRLMNTASDWAKSSDAGGILLSTFTDNVRAQNLYEHLGYERIGYEHPGTADEGYLYILRF